MLSKLEHCKPDSLLTGWSYCLLQKLQKIQNSYSHYSNSSYPPSNILLLHFLSWLPVCYRTKHNVSSLCYISLSDPSSKYLSDLIHSILTYELFVWHSYPQRIHHGNKNVWLMFFRISGSCGLEQTAFRTLKMWHNIFYQNHS